MTDTVTEIVTETVTEMANREIVTEIDLRKLPRKMIEKSTSVVILDQIDSIIGIRSFIMSSPLSPNV